MVKAAGSRNVLVAFEPRPEYMVTMPAWKAAGDFRIELMFQTSRNEDAWEGSTYALRAGTLEMQLRIDDNMEDSTVVLNNSSELLPDLADKSVQLVLAREGNVCKVFINSKQVLLARYDDVSSIEGVSFVVTNPGSDFKLIGIAMTSGTSQSW